jgi:integrase
MWETVPVLGITRKVVRALHASYADRRWRGNAILRTLRLVMNFAIHELEVPGLTRNPAEHMALYETRPREQVWSQAQIDAFLAAASDQPVLRRAFALLLYTVQRPSDVLTLARPMVIEKDGRTWIRLQQAKTKALVDVPCHAGLVAELARTDERKDGNPLLVASPRGKQWRYRNFARAWDKVRSRANWWLAREELRLRGGLPDRRQTAARTSAKQAVRTKMLGDLQRRDLRRTGMIQLAVAGATTPQIAALSGHSIDRIQKILDTYLPRRGEVALGGVEKWEARKHS